MKREVPDFSHEGFGRRLKRLISEKGYTQKELALTCGISEAAMSRYTSNGRFPTTANLYAIARALDVDMDYLAYGKRTGDPDQFDQDGKAHTIFSFSMDARNFVRWDIPETACAHCGGPLEEYYCEERLYLIRCLHCNIVGMAEGRNPQEAAFRTIGVPRNKREGGESDEKKDAV